MRIKYITLATFFALSLPTFNESKAAASASFGDITPQSRVSPFNYNKTEVKIIVVSIIADEIGCNPSALQGEELLIDLGIDSLGMLNIIWETQDFFSNRVQY